MLPVRLVISLCGYDLSRPSTRRMSAAAAYAEESSDELAEYRLGEAARTRHVMLGRIERGSGIELRRNLVDAPHVISAIEPAANQWLIRFQMELQSICIVADAKCLVLADRRARKMDGATRQRECVPMPLEDRLTPLEVAKQEVLLAMMRRRDIRPAELDGAPAQNAAAHARRHELRAEANAEYRHARLDRAANRLLLVSEVREAIRLVGRHRSAQHHEAVVAPDRYLRVAVPMKIHVANAEAGILEHPIEHAERLEGHMLKYQELAQFTRRFCVPRPRDESR